MLPLSFLVVAFDASRIQKLSMVVKFLKLLMSPFSSLLLLLLLLLLLYCPTASAAPQWHGLATPRHGTWCRLQWQALLFKIERYVPTSASSAGHFCTQWVYLQAALHLSRSPTHEGEMPLSLKSFLSTSPKLIGGLSLLPVPSTQI